MSKPLIVIPSCYRDRYTRVTKQRPLLKGCDYKYFLGVGNVIDPTRDDEVILPVGDDWQALPEKCQLAFKWAIEHGYDYVFKTDTDTYVHVDRLLASGYEGFHFIGLVGSMVTQGVYGDCCGGGAGYWLSQTAMLNYLGYDAQKAVKTANWQKNEDWCLLKILAGAGVTPHHDSRYWDFRLGPIPDESTNITFNEWNGEAF